MLKTQIVKINNRPAHKIPKGHPTHRGGSGVHADRRLKRQNTRATQFRAALDNGG